MKVQSGLCGRQCLALSTSVILAITDGGSLVAQSSLLPASIQLTKLDNKVTHYAAYAIGGYRQTHDGAIIGMFTIQKQGQDVLDFQSDVYFFRIFPNGTR